MKPSCWLDCREYQPRGAERSFGPMTDSEFARWQVHGAWSNSTDRQFGSSRATSPWPRSGNVEDHGVPLGRRRRRGCGI